MRWPANAIMGISAGVLAAVALSMFVGCGGGSGAPSPEPPQSSLASPEQVKPGAHSGSAEGAPPLEGAPAEGPGAPHGNATRIRLYLARHDIYASWYPKVGEVTVVRSKVAVVGTSLAADEAGASRKICKAVVDSNLVAAAIVLYGKEVPYACR